MRIDVLLGEALSASADVADRDSVALGDGARTAAMLGRTLLENIGTVAIEVALAQSLTAAGFAVRYLDRQLQLEPETPVTQAER